MSTVVPQVSSELTWRDTLARWALRWDIGRSRGAVEPGLYRVGEPTPESPVLVTANYRMTFDLVRRDLGGLDVWLLVLDTNGVNVWCAAGKGTFGTKELIVRAAKSNLSSHVTHRTLIVPQLGATGVSAHEARQLGDYRVVFGPIRSRDIPAFVAAGMKTTPEMRAVTFTFAERLALTPVELVGTVKGWKLLILLGLLAAGWLLDRSSLATASQPAAAYIAGVLAGGLLTPALLPWLPGHSFSVKGALAGAAAGAAASLALGSAPLGVAAGTLLAAGIASFVGLNFTGATPFTSPSGVEKELRLALPAQAAAAVIAGVLWIVQFFLG
ncbi:MAG: acetyl-CoA synthase subunit gamma [Actinobacteria bacterium]|nr:MAG: acetyl-CoA synthase subunit gamma [Actinomycetota bacterium]